MRKKTSTSLLLGLLAASLVVTPCYASATQKKITATQNTQQENQKQLNDTQGRISSLESKKDDLEGYLKELDRQLRELGENLQEIQTKSEAKQAELDQLEVELKEALAKEEEQYASMKLRIQYMYENSDSSYVLMLLESKNLTDLLSQAENMSQMTKYDRKMLQEYKKTTAEIKEKEECIKKEQKHLEELKKESLDKQNDVSEVIRSTRGQIASYEEKISAEQGNVKTLLNKIQSEKDIINALIKQQKDEEAAEALKKQQQDQQKEQNSVNKAPVETPKQDEVPEKGNGGSSQETPQNKPQVSKPEEKPNQGGTEQESSQGKYLGRFTLTAYCNCSLCGGHSSGLTASGMVPVQGRTVAMDGVPFGTKLLINGSVYTVEDKGTPYGHVDIFFNSHADALQFGRTSADVYQIN